MRVVLNVGMVAAVVAVVVIVEDDDSRPRCHSANCSEGWPAFPEFFYKANGGQLRVEFLDGKYFVMSCDSNGENKPMAVEDPALPSMKNLVTFDKLTIKNCLPPGQPGGSYATALAALNVSTTQLLELEQQPAEPSLSQAHFKGLPITSLRISADVNNPLHPKDGFLVELHKLRALTLDNVVLPTSLLNTLPTCLESLELREAKLSNTEWLKRLLSLKTLTLIEQDSVCGNLTFSSLAALPNLTEMCLYKLNLANIEGMINGSALKSLSLNSCGLTMLPSNMFEGAKLTSLNLTGNNLIDLPNGVFSPLRSLTALDLSDNKLSASALLRALSELHNLQYLNANGNPLGTLCAASGREKSRLPTSLEVLQLRQTNATRVCTDWVAEAENLTSIDMANNNIEVLNHTDLEVISLNRSKGIELKLRGNSQLVVDFDSKDLEKCRKAIFAPGLRVPVKLELEELPCDCRHSWLREALRDCGALLSVPGDTKCRHSVTPEAYVPAHDKLLEYEPDELLCPYKDCVPGCSCFKRARGNATIVRCAGPLAPEPRWPASDPDWPLVVHAAGAGLTAVPRAALEELHAPNNSITSLDIGDLLDSLILLDVRNNSIAQISEAAALKLGRSSPGAKPLRANLSGNPLLCDCDHRAALMHLKAANSQVEDLHYVQCKDKRYLRVLVASDLCNDVVLPALLGVTGITFMILVVVIMLIKLRPKIKQFLFDHQMCLKWVLSVEDTANDPDKTHDVFISYAYEDHALAKRLMRRLEARGHTTVEHCRDWQPGAAVSEHIARSVV